jgi:undecaprenyl-diphosphatase
MSFDLHAPGWLSKHVGVVVIMIILAGLVFGGLAYQLQTNGPMVKWDTQLASQLYNMAVKLPSPVLELLTYGFFLGKEDLQLLGALLVVYFLYKRYWEEILMVLIGWAGGSLIWNPMIHYFNRPRPEQQLGIEVHSIPSFPSGHSMFAMLAWGLLAYMVIPLMPSRFWKWAFGLFALLVVLFIGASRVIQGGHYLSDVVAGYAMAIAWGSLVYTILEAIAIRRRRA